MSLGCDLSKRYLYLACLLTDKVAFTARIDIESEPLEGFNRIQEVLKLSGERQIYIEQPWISNKTPRPITFMELGRSATFVELAALKAGLEPIFVLPTTWRKTVYGTGRPADQKETARKLVLEKFGFETKHKNEHNYAEAILIAHYGDLVSQ